MVYLDERILIDRSFDNYYLFFDKEFGEKIYQLNNEKVSEILFYVRAPFSMIKVQVLMKQC